MIYACAAGNAFFIVNGSRFILIHADCLNLAGIFTGANAIDNRGIRANPRTRSAFAAFGFINMRHMVVVKFKRAEPANVLAAMCQAPTAGIRHLIAAHRAFITCDIDDLNHIRVLFMASHCELHALCKDSALFIDAAAHSRLFTGNNHFRNVRQVLRERIVPCLSGDLAQNFIFQMLHFCIKFAHFKTPLP